ncbi:hypothetical protein [Sphingomonas sp. CARO-RG-8B-R24-01]|uniref:hypothetical protein n=1 Tax=Sphingomonas sp. CARO-RG-8B-R24-01 TaxID=2914831 RepID=UPI001F58A255|nr:hypothetical protein [Sphingomonas sp. CARO-RG-8B-R24-01]
MDAVGVATPPPAAPRAPLWLVLPSRFAALTRLQARWGLGLVALLLAATLLALASPPPPAGNPDDPARMEAQTDLLLYDSIVSGVRGGGDYYSVAANALRRGDYPLRPFVTFRLPALTMIQAHVPPTGMLGILYLLAAGVAAAWFVRLRPAFRRTPPLVFAMLLLAGGMVAFVQRGLIGFHEIWAGLLIALSLALRRDDRWLTAVAIGLVAMLLRETAALYVGIMAVLAFAEGNRREALGWGITLVIFAVVVAFHAHAVAAVVRPTDPASPGWAGLLGFGYFVRTMTLSTALAIAPLLLAAPLVGLALFGWASWPEPLALRALTIFCGYAALLGLFGRSDTFYWGLMIAPALLVGLAFAPDGIRDLIARARDRRKITVTRLVR